MVVPAHDVKQNGACGWGDAAVIIPWNMYLYYGDVSILEQQYDSMKAWVDYIKSRDEAAGGKRLWVNDFHYGDWLSLDVEDPLNRFGGTEPAYLASAFYSYSAGIVSKAARVLNRNEDAEYYRNLSEEIKSAIRKEYFTETGRLAVNTQTAHVIALYMDLVPDEWKERIAFDLRMKLKQTGYHLRTGFLGTPYLCRFFRNTEATISHTGFLQTLIIRAGCIPLQWERQRYGKDGIQYSPTEKSVTRA